MFEFFSNTKPLIIINLFREILESILRLCVSKTIKRYSNLVIFYTFQQENKVCFSYYLYTYNTVIILCNFN